MHNILVSNIGFGQASPGLIDRLREIANISLNEAGVRFDESTLISKIGDANILIAGTEKISRNVLSNAPNLKMIARLGVGVDNIDLECAREKKIQICYTPDAPSQAIPEFTISLILNLLKGIHESDRRMHQGEWFRPMGRMLSSMTIGVVGAGRIGSKVIQLLKSLTPSPIFYADPTVSHMDGATKVDLETLFKNCDIVTLHLPLTEGTKNSIDEKLLCTLKKGSYLINTSRGGIVDESTLFKLLSSKHLAAAAFDVFDTEPYHGPLQQLENCLLTSHIGSLTQEVRGLMEEQVVEDVVRFINKQPILRPLAGFNFVE